MDFENMFEEEAKEEEKKKPVRIVRTKKEPEPVKQEQVKSILTVPVVRCPQCRSTTVRKQTYGIKCKRCGFFPWEQVNG